MKQVRVCAQCERLYPPRVADEDHLCRWCADDFEVRLKRMEARRLANEKC